MEMLKVQNITKSFGGIKAVNNLSFVVDRNTITGLIGPNGAGKTVTFDILTGFTKPDSGKVFFKKQEITNKQPFEIARMGIARSFQLIKLFPQMKVMDVLLFAAQKKLLRHEFRLSLKSNNRYSAIEDVIADLNIANLRDKICSELSYGEQKLVEIASLLVMEPAPEILLFDEPTSGLSEPEIRNIISIFQKLRKRNLTFLIIEHNMSFIMNICDKIIVLNYGSKIAEGKPQEVKQKKEVVEAYLGESESA
jgi:ABC-type branched-subunit amino acid transport system ATPase component